MADIPQTQFNSPWTVSNIEAQLNDCSAAKGTDESLTSRLTRIDESLAQKIAFIDIYGSGTQIPDGSDLNDYDTIGQYYVEAGSNTNTLYHRPLSGAGFRMMVVSSGGNRQQWLYTVSATSRLFIRSKTSTGWKSWYEFTGTQTADISPNT